MRASSVFFVTACLFSLSACSSVSGMFKQKEEAPRTGSLTQHFRMVDSDGRHYGAVEIDPVNGGKVTDVQGRLIGYIYPPSAVQQPVSQTTTAAPTPLTSQPTQPIEPVTQGSPYAYPYSR